MRHGNARKCTVSDARPSGDTEAGMAAGERIWVHYLGFIHSAISTVGLAFLDMVNEVEEVTPHALATQYPSSARILSPYYLPLRNQFSHCEKGRARHAIYVFKYKINSRH